MEENMRNFSPLPSLPTMIAELAAKEERGKTKNTAVTHFPFPLPDSRKKEKGKGGKQEIKPPPESRKEIFLFLLLRPPPQCPNQQGGCCAIKYTTKDVFP